MSAAAAMLLLLAATQASAAAELAGLELKDCRISAGPGFPGIKARCGTLRRPLGPSANDSGSLDLRVAVVPALSLEPEADPFVPIAGGPGQSSIRFYAGYADAFEHIRRERDIVLLDQRGTGGSVPLDCGADEEIFEGQLSTGQIVAATRDCLAELPQDPRFFTTSVAVTDLEALRIALGHQTLNIYGISYGTRVAQHFARRYPASTRTVILDGVVPPQVALGPGIALEAQEALDAIFARCAESRPCHDRFGELAAKFARLRGLLREQTPLIEIPDPVTGRRETLSFGNSELAGAVRILSYHPSTVALVPLLIDEAAAGNYAPLASQFLMAARSLADALSIGMHNAIVCTEDAPFFDEDLDREAIDATYMGAMQLDALQAVCSVWPAGLFDDDLTAPLATDKPVLLLSGDADPITPPEFAAMAAVEMHNSRHLIGKKQGHGQANRTCIPEIMAAFIDSASVEALDESCLDERQFTMPFFLDFTGPSP